MLVKNPPKTSIGIIITSEGCFRSRYTYNTYNKAHSKKQNGDYNHFHLDKSSPTTITNLRIRKFIHDKKWRETTFRINQSKSFNLLFGSFTDNLNENMGVPLRDLSDTFLGPK